MIGEPRETAAKDVRPASTIGRVRLLVESPATLVAGAVFVALIAYVLFYPLVSPYDGNDVEFSRARELPSIAHPLGTDHFGRDLLTRIALGGQTTLVIAAAAVSIILVVGFLWGAVAALAGGVVDTAMMRIVDGLLTIPRLPVAIVILVVLSLHAQNVAAIILALSIVGWMLTARLVRGHVLTLKSRDFVRAARAIGASWPRIARRHIVPNSAGILAVAVFIELPAVVLGEAFLAVLGFGPPAPTATWGNIAYEGLHFSRLWEMFVPTAAIATFAVSANILADGFNDLADPRRGAQRRSWRRERDEPTL
ncbi:MAG: ABC transporter permease [Actinobacteria bacterium]|nr:ABC transporter permease [Actinomycetota bacterium]